MSENKEVEVKLGTEVKASEAAVKSEAVEPKKEKKEKRIKVSKLFFNPRAWTSYDEVSSNTRTTIGLFRRLFSHISREKRQETYEEAIARLNLNDEQVIARKKNFLNSSLVYFVFALGFFLYFVYLLLNLNILPAILTTFLVVLMLLAGYREHFWYMQMEKKKLGCNFKDWLAFVLKRRI